MDFKDVIEKRRSIRKYKGLSVSDDQVLRVIEAARLAPSAANKYPCRFIVVRDPEVRRELAGNQIWAAGAPVIIVALGDAAASPNWWPNDVGIAFEHVMLATANERLGTCWMGCMERDAEIKGLLGIPDHVRVVAITPLGSPDETPGPKQRKSMEEARAMGHQTLTV
jgi:nitroreductase